ncbi:MULTISPECIES: hypothetical protein [unclassified Nocardia]|uniref:hypothetical protein n=1 Tax=unclassified Nocardia TaxID=2637762 RepID=UPI0024A7B77C|nr:MULTISPECIES: hypothetical protein [unclassified Nocardia]
MTGHISYQHRDDGIWPVGVDGWPLTAEELDVLEHGAAPLELTSQLEIIDVTSEDTR